MIVNKEHNEDSDDAKCASQFGEERRRRIVFISEPIGKDLATSVTKSLLILDEISNEPIKIFINSPGGDVYSGFFIYDCIRFLHSPIYVIGSGLVASAAALIYLAVKKERRYCFPHASFLLHQPLSGMRGTVTDLEIHARELDAIKITIRDIIAKETKQKIQKVAQDIDRDFWLHAEASIQYGLTNKILSSKQELLSIFPKKELKKTARMKKKSEKVKQNKENKKKASSDAMKEITSAKKLSSKSEAKSAAKTGAKPAVKTAGSSGAVKTASKSSAKTASKKAASTKTAKKKASSSKKSE